VYSVDYYFRSPSPPPLYDAWWARPGGQRPQQTPGGPPPADASAPSIVDDGKEREGDVSVVLTDDATVVEDWVKREVCEWEGDEKGRRWLGFDAEWPAHYKRSHSEAQTSLVQLTSGRPGLPTLLIRFPLKGGTSESLRSVMADPTVKKAGVNIGGDVEKIRQDWPEILPDRVEGLYDIGFGIARINFCRDVAPEVQATPAAWLESPAKGDICFDYDDLWFRVNRFDRLGLFACFKKATGEALEKDTKTTRSNWDKKILTHSQITYAAQDSVLGAVVYGEMKDELEGGDRKELMKVLEEMCKVPHRKFFKKAKRICKESDEGRDLLLDILRGEGVTANLCTWLWRAGGNHANMKALSLSQMGMANFGAAVVAGQGHLTKDLGLEFGEHHMEVLWDRVKRCFPDIANQILSTRQPQHRRGETVILEEGEWGDSLDVLNLRVVKEEISQEEDNDPDSPHSIRRTMTVSLSNNFICRGTSSKVRGARDAAYRPVLERLLNNPKVSEAVVLGRLAEFYGADLDKDWMVEATNRKAVVWCGNGSEMDHAGAVSVSKQVMEYTRARGDTDFATCARVMVELRQAGWEVRPDLVVTPNLWEDEWSMEQSAREKRERKKLIEGDSTVEEWVRRLGEHTVDGVDLEVEAGAEEVDEEEDKEKNDEEEEDKEQDKEDGNELQEGKELVHGSGEKEEDEELEEVAPSKKKILYRSVRF